MIGDFPRRGGVLVSESVDNVGVIVNVNIEQEKDTAGVILAK